MTRRRLLKLAAAQQCVLPGTEASMKRPTCARCSNTGAVGTAYCDCRAGARLRDRHAHWQRLLDEERAESLARVERVIEALPELSLDEMIGRLRRMAQVIALDEQQCAAAKASHVGNRPGRSRRARAAHARWDALEDQRHSIMRTFDKLDDDMYRTVRGNEEMQARLFSFIAQGEA